MNPAIIAALITAAGSMGGAAIGASGRGKETSIQKQQRKTIDQILAGIQGQGPYANMFSVDRDLFKQTVEDPMMETFRNRGIPQIQQSYIASGQQRGTGMDDTLTRAGVDLQGMVSEQYGKYVNDAMNRRVSALGNVTGAGAGFSPDTSASTGAQAVGGYLASDDFGKMVDLIMKSLSGQGGSSGQSDSQAYDQMNRAMSTGAGSTSRRGYRA
ncbi:MAG: hypothetical protein Q8O94_03540 [bacterium]|nr:hypothetical protein [bacterium]